MDRAIIKPTSHRNASGAWLQSEAHSSCRQRKLRKIDPVERFKDTAYAAAEPREGCHLPHQWEAILQTNRMWGLFEERDRLKPPTVDLKQFDVFLHHREKKDEELSDYIRSLDLPTANLFYEDLLRDQQEFLNQLFQFLEVRP